MNRVHYFGSLRHASGPEYLCVRTMTSTIFVHDLEIITIVR